MFATPDLSARIDRAEGRMCAGIARFAGSSSPDLRSEVFEIGGGLAVFAGPGSPTNKMIGVGFEGVPDERELERVEQQFIERQSPLQAEVSTLADPAFHACLMRRGYTFVTFENVLGHPLTTLDSRVLNGIHVASPEPDELAEWVDVVATGFANPDEGGVAAEVLPPPDELRKWFRTTMSIPGFEGFLAKLDGRIAGGAAMRMDMGIAQLCGAATLPAFRRRGVQTALLRWRLDYARRRGCDVAVITTQPASKSQQNAQREGFHLLYARQLLVKQP